MRLLSYPGIKLPTVYVASDDQDVTILRGSGLPYILSRDDDDTIVLSLLFHWLAKRFPHIDWALQLGIRRTRSYTVIVPGRRLGDERREELAREIERNDSKLTLARDEEREVRVEEDVRKTVHDMADDVREFDGTTGDEVMDSIVDLVDFSADELAHVNIEQLQALGMLPAFMSDVADAIKTNLLNSMMWRDGWNKRLACSVGDYMSGTKAPNLIILDISGSIPNGISATMLQLIDSLRSQAEADLIITGGSSYYWPASEELPSVEWIRANVTYDNEAVMFYRILSERLAGRHFGNVISFGDDDCPVDYAWYDRRRGKAMGNEELNDERAYGIQVDRVMHFHTRSENTQTGYAKWVHVANPDVTAVYDTSWCRVMR